MILFFAGLAFGNWCCVLHHILVVEWESFDEEKARADDIEFMESKTVETTPRGKSSTREGALSHWCASRHVGFCSVCSFPVPSFNLSKAGKVPHIPLMTSQALHGTLLESKFLQNFSGAAEVCFELGERPCDVGAL